LRLLFIVSAWQTKKNLLGHYYYFYHYCAAQKVYDINLKPELTYVRLRKQLFYINSSRYPFLQVEKECNYRFVGSGVQPGIILVPWEFSRFQIFFCYQVEWSTCKFTSVKSNMIEFLLAINILEWKIKYQYYAIGYLSNTIQKL